MDSKKGKSVTTSVPSISIKFHANAEEIEELRFSDDDQTPNLEEKNTPLLGSINTVSSSTSLGDQDTSPLKLFPKLVKRSTSVDVSAQPLSSSPPSDPWRFFTDIKGKITKSVEEKITEIKARHEEGSPSHKPKTEVKTPKEGKLEKFSNNKENSSFSDSEEQSESSISKTCGFISTTEGVEMSSDDETSSIDKDKKLHSPSVIRQRFRFLQSQSYRNSIKEGTVNINSLSKLYNINTERVEQALPEDTEDIESAVDALEETDFQLDSPKKTEKDVGQEEIIRKVSQKISNIEVDSENVVNIKEVSGEDVGKSFFSGDIAMSTVFAPTGFVDVRTMRSSNNESNMFPYMLLAIYLVLYAILHTYTPYLAGFVLGATLALILGYIYLKLYAASVSTVATNTGSSLGVFANRIMEIPAVKEYQPLTKYEGWLNEYPDAYDPLIYHITQTQSVFLRLQGNLLRISHSKTKVPKRAMWNESEIKASFSHHRIYNLLNAKINLLPEGLTKIRLWSKKYPICITLNKDQMNFDPALAKMELEDKEEKNGDNGKSPKAKKKFTFKKREYPYMAQRFSQLTQDQDIDLDSDSRASTPSPEISDLVPDDAIAIQEPEDKPPEDDMHSLPDDWSDVSQNVSTKSFKSINKSPARHPSPAHNSLDESTKDGSSEIKLYLFGRTDREKEDWFRRFAAATHHTEETPSIGGEQDLKETDSNVKMSRTELEYIKYMTLFNKPTRKKSKQDKSDSEVIDKQNSEDIEEPKTDTQLWFNAIIGRVLFDCMRDPGFTKKVQNRIQKKLQTIKLPYFIEEIMLTELNLGKNPPFILRTEKPVLDDRGLWVDLDISYEGMIVLTLQTKINLMKLKNPQVNDKSSSEIKSAIYHSDVDDSAESSSDEDGPQEIPLPREAGSAQPPPPHGSKKFIKMVDRIAESKFFQAATKNRYIIKAMEGVSNTELRLTVEIKAVAGTMVLNIPPPPSDRIWVGFRPVPELILTACPIVGDRNVTYAMVTSWIEKKLLQEFQKVMVIPNMEDFVVPVMDPKLPE